MRSKFTVSDYLSSARLRIRLSPQDQLLAIEGDVLVYALVSSLNHRVDILTYWHCGSSG